MATIDGVGGIDNVRGAFKKQRRQRTAPPPRHPKKDADQAQNPAIEAPAAAPSVAAIEQPIPQKTPPPAPAGTATVEPAAGRAPVSPPSAPEPVEATGAAETATAPDTPPAPVPHPEPVTARTENSPAVTPAPEAPEKPVETTPAAAKAKPRGAATTPPAQGSGGLPAQKQAWVMPEDSIEPDDPTALYVKPTVAKIPVPVMRRFNNARRGAASHTAVVLDAMAEHAHELDQLILRHRPEIAARYTRQRMPLRRLTMDKQTKDDLRIRPTEAELGYLKALVDSINAWLEANWPKIKPTDQSEVLTVLLDAYLPAPKPKKETAAS
ncbi:hypothetical protein [Nocardia sp. NPDC051570]|uniref:hypothetical protein n=1 Tax=Nocardia sp. NPDC051570 TaxID=3364324 RepID=UPI0037B2349B